LTVSRLSPTSKGVTIMVKPHRYHSKIQSSSPSSSPASVIITLSIPVAFYRLC
jgi:hypothetical protein